MAKLGSTQAGKGSKDNRTCPVERSKSAYYKSTQAKKDAEYNKGLKFEFKVGDNVISPQRNELTITKLLVRGDVDGDDHPMFSNPGPRYELSDGSVAPEYALTLYIKDNDPFDTGGLKFMAEEMYPPMDFDPIRGKSETREHPPLDFGEDT